MALPMVKIPGVPDNADMHDGMAFFANTGPFGTMCGDCTHRGYYKSVIRKGEDDGVPDVPVAFRQPRSSGE